MACCFVGNTSKSDGGDLAKGNRIIGQNSWPTMVAPEGANAFWPSAPSIWVATLWTQALAESRRDLLPEPDEDNSSPDSGHR